MRATRLTDYWKDANEYVRSLVLITRRYSIDDIKSCGKEVVLFGWVPGAALVLATLKNAGIDVKYVCEVHQIPSDEFPDGMPVCAGGGNPYF